jgi:SSS family solute:Na+ symporter
LKSLDQAYQYIQEYTGFIYPGVFLIFFCGLFWRQATANAALWIALLTIPLGILFKIISPDLPFILRIGYVFIILSVVMVGLSLLDKSHRIANPLADEISRSSAVRSGWVIIAIASVIGLVVVFFVSSMRHLALEAVYVLVVGFILIGLIIIFNNTRRTMDTKGTY